MSVNGSYWALMDHNGSYWLWRKVIATPLLLSWGWTFGIGYLNRGLSPPSLQPQIDSPKSWIYFPYPHIITTIKYSDHLITNYDAIIPIHDLQGCGISYQNHGVVHREN
ncbi:hypothetical protein HanPSC8_Chr05g0199931 [Helianthus annuus]|nr:hypothetical protein HanPSC8_Chr05g0199931 [Helianthus annuus]